MNTHETRPAHRRNDVFESSVKNPSLFFSGVSQLELSVGIRPLASTVTPPAGSRKRPSTQCRDVFVDIEFDVSSVKPLLGDVNVVESEATFLT